MRPDKLIELGRRRADPQTGPRRDVEAIQERLLGRGRSLARDGGPSATEGAQRLVLEKRPGIGRGRGTD